jgi:hypothetical protein
MEKLNISPKSEGFLQKGQVKVPGFHGIFRPDGQRLRVASTSEMAHGVTFTNYTR